MLIFDLPPNKRVDLSFSKLNVNITPLRYIKDVYYLICNIQFSSALPVYTLLTNLQSHGQPDYNY